MEMKVGLNQYITQINRADSKSNPNPLIPAEAVRTIMLTAHNVVNIKAPELSEHDKEMILTCIKYQIKHFEAERYHIETEYDKFEHFDQDYENRINALKDSEKYYTELAEKLDKII